MVRDLGKAAAVTDSKYYSRKFRHADAFFQLVAMELKDVTQYVLSDFCEVQFALENAWQWYLEVMLGNQIGGADNKQITP